MKASIKISGGIVGRITITFPYDPVRVVKSEPLKVVGGIRMYIRNADMSELGDIHFGKL